MKNKILMLNLIFTCIAVGADREDGINWAPLQQAFQDKPLKVVGLGCGACCVGSCLASGALACCGYPGLPVCLSWPVTGGIAAGSLISDCCIRKQAVGEKMLSLSVEPKVKPSVLSTIWGFSKENFGSVYARLAFNKMGLEEHYDVIAEGMEKEQKRD